MCKWRKVQIQIQYILTGEVPWRDQNWSTSSTLVASRPVTLPHIIVKGTASVSVKMVWFGRILLWMSNQERSIYPWMGGCSARCVTFYTFTPLDCYNCDSTSAFIQLPSLVYKWVINSSLAFLTWTCSLEKSRVTIKIWPCHWGGGTAWG